MNSIRNVAKFLVFALSIYLVFDGIALLMMYETIPGFVAIAAGTALLILTTRKKAKAA